MNKNKSIISLAIIFWTIIFIAILFLICYLLYSFSPRMFKIKVNDTNFPEILPLVDFFELDNVKKLEEISLISQYNNPETFDVQISYRDIDKRERKFTSVLTRYMIQNNNTLYNSINYIKNNGIKNAESSIHTLEINGNNLKYISTLIDYLKINDIKTINCITMNIQSNNCYNVGVSYINSIGESSNYHCSLSKFEIDTHNPLLDSVTFIEENSHFYKKHEFLNPLKNITLCAKKHTPLFFKYFI